MGKSQVKKLMLDKETVRDLLEPVSAVSPQGRQADCLEALYGGVRRKRWETIAPETNYTCWGSCDYVCI